MNSFTSLTNQFLIAMPSLADPNFARSVTLICEHSPEGAMGIVINRPTDMHLSDIYRQLEIDVGRARHGDTPVYLGGPVQNNRGFVLHEPLGGWDSTLHISDTIGVSTSRDILQAIAEDRGLTPAGHQDSSSGRLWRIPGSPDRHTGRSSSICRPISAGPLPPSRWAST